jgi:hypothetical protein
VDKSYSGPTQTELRTLRSPFVDIVNQRRDAKSFFQLSGWRKKRDESWKAEQQGRWVGSRPLVLRYQLRRRGSHHHRPLWSHFPSLSDHLLSSLRHDAAKRCDWIFRSWSHDHDSISRWSQWLGWRESSHGNVFEWNYSQTRMRSDTTSPLAEILPPPLMRQMKKLCRDEDWGASMMAVVASCASSVRIDRMRISFSFFFVLRRKLKKLFRVGDDF